MIGRRSQSADRPVWVQQYQGTGGNDVSKEAELKRWGVESWMISLEKEAVDGTSPNTFIWMTLDRNDLLFLHKRLGEELGV